MPRICLIMCLSVGGCREAATEPATAAFALSTPDVTALSMGTDDATVAREGAPLGEATAKGLIAELDGRMADIVSIITALVTEKPASASATEVVWVGDSGGVVFRFTETRGGPNRFGWLLEAHGESAPDTSYATVLAGGIRRNTDAHRGTGYFALDYNHFAAAAAGSSTTVTARGLFGAVFAHTPQGTLLAYELKNYTSGAEPPHSAYYQTVRVDKTAAHPALAFFRAGGQRDLLAGDAGAPALAENVIVRARRAAGVGGWARAVVFGGDAPTGTAFLFRECWSAANAVAYRRVWACAIDSDGSLSACKFKSTKTLVQVGGAALPSDGEASNPDGFGEKETLRKLCFSELGPGLAAAAIAEKDPPANTDDTAEDVAAAGAPADDTPASSDSVTSALSADGSAPGI